MRTMKRKNELMRGGLREKHEHGVMTKKAKNWRPGELSGVERRHKKRGEMVRSVPRNSAS